jgi:hypothetical protein
VILRRIDAYADADPFIRAADGHHYFAGRSSTTSATPKSLADRVVSRRARCEPAQTTSHRNQ